MIGGWRSLTRRSVIVSLDTGRSFEGVLLKTSGPLLIMREVRALERGQQAVRVDGEVVVDRRRVEFVQMVDGIRP